MPASADLPDAKSEHARRRNLPALAQQVPDAPPGTGDLSTRRRKPFPKRDSLTSPCPVTWEVSNDGGRGQGRWLGAEGPSAQGATLSPFPAGGSLASSVGMLCH